LTTTLAELAQLVGGRVRGDEDRPIEAVRTLESAGPHDLSFLTNPKYRAAATDSAAGALLVGEATSDFEGTDLLVAPDPHLALARILKHLHPSARPAPGIHASAVIDGAAVVAASATVGAHCVVGVGSRIGDRAVLHAGVVVEAECEIGDDSELHPGVVLYARTVVGRRCMLHSGVVLGSDGFGFAEEAGTHEKIPQIGRVVVEDDVEIGANSTVDCAMLEETRIGAGTKIDNLVQIGHNVTIGAGSLLVAQSGIAGSTRLGKGTILAGQAGVSGHLEIGDGARVAAASAVFKSVPAGVTVAGIPAREVAAWRREQALVQKLAELWRRIRALEGRLTKEGDDRE
jgi:UDP-3-O-[3-hydroxymyristoyl] glucosamine N-acyltransferase